MKARREIPEGRRGRARTAPTAAGTVALIVAVLVLFGGLGLAPWSTPREGAPNDMGTVAGPFVTPSPRAYHRIAYDVGSDRIVLFGGALASGHSDETWTYDFDSNNWIEMSPAVRPAAREGFAMAYDTESDVVVVFGGWSLARTGGFNDTWAYRLDTDTWTNMSPPSGPSARWGLCAAYDAESDRIIAVGGHAGTTRYRETWAYDYDTNTWTDLTGPVRPSYSNWCAVAYDAESDRIILFGGEGGTGTSLVLSDETWSYDYNTNTWLNLDPNPKPTRRWFNALGYDSQSDRTVLFGGELEFYGGLLDDQTWAFHLNTTTWTSMSPGVHPYGVMGDAMTYDSESDRLVLFGGFGGATLSNETWAYDFDTNTWTPMMRPSAPRNLQASATDGEVSLSWTVPSATGGNAVTNYRIYRGTDSGSASFLVEVANVLTYTDTGLTNGVAYYYQVTAVTVAGEGPSSNEVSATPMDTTNPTIAITSPANGEIVRSASIEIRGIASDNNAVERVEVSRDEVNWILATGTTSWSAIITLEEGDNIVSARATDTSGNTVTVSVPVTFRPDRTRPVIVISSPVNGAIFTSTTVTVTGIASDDVDLEKVELSADGTNWILATGTTSWLGTISLREGSNTIYARATDTSGNTATEGVVVTLQIAPAPPPPLDVVTIAFVVAAVAGVGIVGALFVLRRRKK